jgi:hypothetical protein
MWPYKKRDRDEGEASLPNLVVLKKSTKTQAEEYGEEMGYPPLSCSISIFGRKGDIGFVVTDPESGADSFLEQLSPRLKRLSRFQRGNPRRISEGEREMYTEALQQNLGELKEVFPERAGCLREIGILIDQGKIDEVNISAEDGTLEVFCIRYDTSQEIIGERKEEDYLQPSVAEAAQA